MRCLTFAIELEKHGAKVVFVSKSHEGHIITNIKQRGFAVAELTAETDFCNEHHSSWLGSSEQEDASKTISVIKNQFGAKADWTIIDHYAIGTSWESLVREHAHKIFVIDDLADRHHDCDVLLDQTFGRRSQDYKAFVNTNCALLLGTKFALLREEFQVSQDEVIKLRNKRVLANQCSILVMMGGTDPFDLTSAVLSKVLACTIDEEITVILGSTAPYRSEVVSQFSHIDRVKIIIDAKDVSEIMLEHDICFGAAGSSSWERCALGLPSLLFAFADNQKLILENLQKYGAVISLPIETPESEFASQLSRLKEPDLYMNMVHNCLNVCDGAGVHRARELVLNECN